MRVLRENRVLVALALLPMLLGTLLLWSLADRVERVDAVPAAVVNLDDPVHTGRGEDRQIVAAGRLLAAGLTDPRRESAQPFSWQLTTPEDAADGLRDGHYYTVVTIPRDFSATVAGLTRNDPETARITVRSNEAASAVVGVVGEQVADVVATRLNQRITATFVQGMFARTGGLKASLGRAEDGARRVATGAGRLGDGTSQVSLGADRLAGGLGTLSGGAGRLSRGADDLASGARRLRAGAARLDGGAERLAAGAGRLGSGIGRLHERTRPLPGRAGELAAGADRLAEGTAGWSQVLLAWKQACTTDPVLLAGHARLCAATVQAVGVDGGNAEAMVGGSRRLADGADELAAGSGTLVSALGRASRGADRVAAGADRLAWGTDRLTGGTARLAAGAGRLSDGADRLSAGATTARDGAVRIADGSARLADGTVRLSRGSTALAEGLGAGAERIPALDPAERRELAGVAAEPVAGDVRAAGSATAGLVPGALALALWIGSLVLHLLRRALPLETDGSPPAPGRPPLTRWVPAVLAGLAQSLLLLAVPPLFGVPLQSPALLALFLVLAGAAVAAVHQAVFATLGQARGMAVSVGLVVIQAVSLGGLLPLDTAPAAIRWAGSALPVPLVAEGVGGITVPAAGGSVLGPALALLAWGAVGLAVAAWSARRRQRLTLADVRREVAGARG